MDYRPLGRTGIEVSPLCLGTMMFGAWGNQDHDDSIRIIHRALDAGINFVDTADVYSDGESEEIVGKALKGRRDDVVLATKFFMPTGPGPNSSGGSRRYIISAVENSSAACRRTTSTCTRCIVPALRPMSRRRSGRCQTWCTRARSDRSGRPPTRAHRSSKRRSPPATVIWSGS
ncbi:hypothetical protein GCM10025867_36020 [Frondihabitans sucicola]|uniref:NADP-dependent oxidoreductase domain-containing protein n=1 Tax=Frondihabitans sucicola TaxID=1268041 RepID=A0ABM8GSB1_9MICO|nr:hypothetical protein GCM10025867_36020 [Frondihabitans sucicola]